jgi:Holliday junction resolvasome RuvABC endonuclease subunit
MEFRAAATGWMDEVSIVAVEKDYTTNRISHIAKPVEFWMEQYKPELGAITQPTIKLHRDAAVQLMDALWLAGLRPSDYKSASGEIQRLEAHIADLRKIAFQSAQP